MTQEQIEAEARIYSSIQVGGPRHLEDFFEREKFEAGFIAGAQWRVNSVWHDMSEEPKHGCMMILHGNGKTTSFNWNGDIKWKNIDKFFRAEKWAYMDDLLPIKEE